MSGPSFPRTILYPSLSMPETALQCSQFVSPGAICKRYCQMLCLKGIRRNNDVHYLFLLKFSSPGPGKRDQFVLDLEVVRRMTIVLSASAICVLLRHLHFNGLEGRKTFYGIIALFICRYRVLDRKRLLRGFKRVFTVQEKRHRQI